MVKVIDRVIGEILEGPGAIDVMQDRVKYDYGCENAIIVKTEEDTFEIVRIKEGMCYGIR
jgi:hypothetical protein